MVVYVVTAIIYVLVLINWILAEYLYKEPTNKAFFSNVTTMNLAKERYIAANPKYVSTLSILVGIFVGFYLGLAKIFNVASSITLPALSVIFVMYLMEITRTITLKEGKLTLSRFLYITKQFDVTKISGIYIYSHNRKFLNKHAYTTKLVVVENSGKKSKFSLSSLDNKAVLNLIKDIFGVTNNKMFIGKTREIK